MWRHFLHDFDASVIVSNCKCFWNIDIWHENISSTFLISAVIKKVMSNLFLFWSMHMIREAPLWSITPCSSRLSSRNIMNYFQATKNYWQSTTSPFKIPVNCVISGVIFTGGSHQRVKISIIEMIPVRCQNFRRKFDDMVTKFWEPCCLRIKNDTHKLGKWHLLLLKFGFGLWYLIDWTPYRLSARKFTYIFRVWWVLLQEFRKVLPVVPHFFLEATCMLLANQIWCFDHQFCTEVVKVKSCPCCFFHSDSKTTIFWLPGIFNRNLNMHSRCTQNPRFLLTNISVNTNILTDPNHTFLMTLVHNIFATNFTIVGYETSIRLSWSNTG